MARFSHQHWLVDFNWKLTERKFLQVSRTRLGILTNLSNALVWMISILYLIPNFSGLFSKILGTVPSAVSTIGITVTLMFHNFFSFLARTKYLSIFSFPFIFTLWSAGMAKFLRWQVLFCIGQIFWPVFGDRFYISKSRRILCVLFSWTDSGLCINHLFILFNLNLLYNSQWITFPTQSWRVLYSFCASLVDLLRD